jgi:alanine racemase
MTTAVRLTIDLDAIAHNFRVLRGLAGAAEVSPVVKADGYGLGAVPIARRLRAEGARSFYVARLAEGEALRVGLGAGPTIYVLDGCPAGAAERLRDADLIPVLNSLEQVDDFGASGGGTAALHIDTGMNRLGLRPEEAQGLAAAPQRLKGVEVAVVASHLACCDDPTNPMNARQATEFASLRRLFPQARASLSSSGGVFLGGDYLHDQVRPGISLYGGGPTGRTDARLRQAARLEAPILQVRDLPAGESIGYGSAFTAETPLKVAVMAAGYADGLLRAGCPRGFGWYAGARRRLLGRLSMDLTALDVTGCQAAPGEMIEMLGPNAPVDDVAAAAGTISYEYLVRISARAERVYVGGV